MTLADRDPESSDHSSSQTQRARKSSDSLSSSANLPQKREQHDVAYGKQGGRAKEMIAGTSTPASYAEGQQSKVNHHEKRVRKGWWYGQHGST